MNTPDEVFQITLPTGQKTKPYSRSKIVAALNGGKVPQSASVDVGGRKVNIVDFCAEAAPVDLEFEDNEGGMDSDKPLYKASPSMFRNAPVHFTISVLLIAAYGFGLLILLIWFLRCWGLKLIVDGQKTTLRKGILSKSITEVRHKDVRNVQISQSFLQRIFGVGKVGISSSGQGGLEIEIAGLPAPAKIKAIIDQYRD